MNSMRMRSPSPVGKMHWTKFAIKSILEEPN